jgi:mRNA interferase YafQ
VRRLEKQGKDMEKLQAIVVALQNRQSLPPRNRDHALAGQWKGVRECHVEPDWLLIYERGADWLRLVRTGGHSELELEETLRPSIVSHPKVNGFAIAIDGLGHRCYGPYAPV